LVKRLGSWCYYLFWFFVCILSYISNFLTQLPYRLPNPLTPYYLLIAWVLFRIPDFSLLYLDLAFDIYLILNLELDFYFSSLSAIFGTICFFRETIPSKRKILFLISLPRKAFLAISFSFSVRQ